MKSSPRQTTFLFLLSLKIPTYTNIKSPKGLLRLVCLIGNGAIFFNTSLKLSGPIASQHSIFSSCLNGWFCLSCVCVCVHALCSEKQRTCSLSAEWGDCRVIVSCCVGAAKITCLQGHTNSKVFLSLLCNQNILLGVNLFPYNGLV